MTTRTFQLGLIAALALILAALTAPAIAAASPPCAGADLMPTTANGPALRAATLCLINVERTRRGLKPVVSNSELRRAAQGHSDDMVAHDFFDHGGPGASTLSSRVRGASYLRGARHWSLAENIAWGCGDYSTPRSTVQSWIESRGHRVNMLSPRYHQIGVGVAVGAPEDAFGEPAATYTTDFGRRTLR